MHTLNSTDWQIFLLYLFCVFAVGVTLRSKIKTGKDFFQAGRAMPALVCMLAFAAASIGVLDVIAMGAAGASAAGLASPKARTDSRPTAAATRSQ